MTAFWFDESYQYF